MPTNEDGTNHGFAPASLFLPSWACLDPAVRAGSRNERGVSTTDGHQSVQRSIGKVLMAHSGKILARPTVRQPDSKLQLAYVVAASNPASHARHMLRRPTGMPPSPTKTKMDSTATNVLGIQITLLS